MTPFTSKDRRPAARLAYMARRGAALAASVAMLLGFTQVQAESGYPSRPITIVVPYGAGGAVDIVTRTLGQSLSEQLGQPVIVDNRTGAGGNVGSAMVANSTPDGYTLLMGGPANTVAGKLYSDLQYDPLKDLTPIALVGAAPSVLLAAPNLPVNNLQELVDLARSKPGSLTFGHGGKGTTTEHLAGELFALKAGAQLVSVPYKGGAAAMNDLIGGRTSIMFTNLLNAVPQVKSGRLKALAIASPERSKFLPDVPTFAELGFPDFNVAVWWGLMGPAGIPPEIVAKLNGEVVKALASTQMQERLAALSAQPLGGTPEEFAARYAAEADSWARTLQAAGLATE